MKLFVVVSVAVFAVALCGMSVAQDMAAPAPSKTFVEIDQDANGQVTYAEYVVVFGDSEDSKAAFGSKDANTDGVLVAEEFVVVEEAPAAEAAVEPAPAQ